MHATAEGGGAGGARGEGWFARDPRSAAEHPAPVTPPGHLSPGPGTLAGPGHPRRRDRAPVSEQEGTPAMSHAEPSLTGPSPAGSPESPAGPGVPAGLAVMQALDDAIAFRRARLGAPCAGCAPAGPCPDHAADARLVTSYEQRHYAAFLRACAALGLDPAGAVAAAGDGDTQTLTAWAVGASLVSRLRERAAAGPVLEDLGDGPAVYVLAGDDLVEYPAADLAGDLTS